MTVRLDDVAHLAYLARRLRKETYGCAQWDEAGTYSVIREFVGRSYGETLHLVVGHSMDPKAQTPGAMRRPFVPQRTDEPGRRLPAKVGEDCKRHPGEYVGACRGCAVDSLTSEHDVVLDDDRSAGRALRDAIRARRKGVAPEHSPAPDGATSEPVDGTRQRAGEPDRPETACAAPGCFRPTRDGICDRCREQAAAEDAAAANAELVDRLKAQQRERAASRPAPDPGPPRYFTSDDYDPERVHAAQARATTERSTT